MRDIKVKKRIDNGLNQLSSIYKNEPVINSILCGRGVASINELDLSLKGLLQPGLMVGLGEAAEVLKQAITNKEKILIVGDYDVDGATSTALMVRVLKKFAVKTVDYLVPNRFQFGYGLSPELVEFAVKHKNPDLIITVDNGIASIEGVSYAKSSKIKVLITDHHLPGDVIPCADAILNPVLDKKNLDFKNLAGVGVAFYLLAQTRILLKELGWFESNHLPIPKLSSYLDLVALGTIADLVPLDCNNRRLVFNGLKIIKEKIGNRGILALIHVSEKSPSLINESDLAFSVAPKINAAGRLADISTGIECMLADQQSECEMYAKSLNRINNQRKVLQTTINDEALKIASSLSSRLKNEDVPFGFSLFRSDWHQGVSGIVASKIKEVFNRPVVVFAKDKNGILKGSARSIAGVHIRDVLSYIDSSWPGIIKQFGGHAMAAGLSINANRLKAFGTKFNFALNQLYNDEYFDEIIYTDGELSHKEYSLRFLKKLEQLRPWGNGFPEPKFDGKFDIIEMKVLKGGHIRMELKPFGLKDTVEAIAFGAENEAWTKNAKSFLAVFRLQINRFRNLERVQLIMDKVIRFK